MRPAKKILCVNDNEDELSVLTFMLKTYRYRVVTAMDVQGAVSEFQLRKPDLVIVKFSMPQTGGNQIIQKLKAITSYIPMVLFGDRVDLETPHHADVFICNDISNKDILDRIKVLSSRKRGPRHGSPEAMRCGPNHKEVAA